MRRTTSSGCLFTRLVARLILVVSPGLVACSKPIDTPLSPTRGYILVSLDTLGAKHLGAYGYERETSPFLDRLAAESLVFDNAVVQYTSTLVSHTSMFTGLYPQEHGVYPPSSKLSPEVETLPEAFQRAGYSTAAFTEGAYMVEEYGFDRGFDIFEAGAAGEREIEKTLAKGIEYLEGVKAEESFFLFLHSYSVHNPYTPPEEFADMFWQGDIPEGSGTTGGFLRDVYMGRRVLSPEALDHVRSLYDALVRYTDQVIEGFVAELERLGLMDEITLIITSDHGEEFLEHGKLGHHQVYPETLFVPLIVVRPGMSTGRRVSTLVESVDLLPTLCELAGIPCPERSSGESLVPLFSGPTDRDGTAYAEVLDQQEMRTLFVQEGGGFHQVVTSSRIAEPGGTWFAWSIRFDAEGEELPVRLVSFAKPREVRVTIDGAESAPVPIGEGWQEVVLDLGGPGRHTVELSTDGCDVPMWLGRGDDTRCLSLKVDGAPLARAELFDLGADRWAANDISVEQPELFQRLREKLEGHRFEPVAAPEAIDPSEATSQSLRALGYSD